MQAHATGKRPLHSITNQPGPEPERYRSKGLALVLALLLGAFGAHHFYLGYYGRGAAYVALAALVGFTLLLGVVGMVFGSAAYGGFLLVGITLAFVQQGLVVADIIRIISGDFKPRNGEYYPRFFQVSPDRAPAADPTTK